MDLKPDDIYRKVEEKARKIENELKRLNRWDSNPLPERKFENMGAFGSNTMTFEQWLQFILLPRIKDIINESGEFPKGSMLAPYAIRYFDGDPDAGNLHDLLYQLDDIVNDDAKDFEIKSNEMIDEQSEIISYNQDSNTIAIGDVTIPEVLYTLVKVLPQFEGDDLESQLQTYDTFLAMLSSGARPLIHDMLMKAADRTTNSVSKVRIESAAKSILQGGRAAPPYDHNAAMKKYTEEHKRATHQNLQNSQFKIIPRIGR